MKHTESCYGSVSNQSRDPQLPMLTSSVVNPDFTSGDEGIKERSIRFFGRAVDLTRCHGPAVSNALIARAFGG